MQLSENTRITFKAYLQIVVAEVENQLEVCEGLRKPVNPTLSVVIER